MAGEKMIDEKIIAAYGADPARWPDGAGLSGRAAAFNPKAGRILAEAIRVDQALGQLPQPAPADAALRAALLTLPFRVLQDRPALKSRRFDWWPFGAILGGPLPQLGGLALACLLGLAVGYSDMIGNPLINFGRGNDLTNLTLGVDVPAGFSSLEGTVEK